MSQFSAVEATLRRVRYEAYKGVTIPKGLRNKIKLVFDEKTCDIKIKRKKIRFFWKIKKYI